MASPEGFEFKDDWSTVFDLLQDQDSGQNSPQSRSSMSPRTSSELDLRRTAGRGGKSTLTEADVREAARRRQREEQEQADNLENFENLIRTKQRMEHINRAAEHMTELKAEREQEDKRERVKKKALQEEIDELVVRRERVWRILEECQLAERKSKVAASRGKRGVVAYGFLALVLTVVMLVVSGLFYDYAEVDRRA
jgi:hypothetical protein